MRMGSLLGIAAVVLQPALAAAQLSVPGAVAKPAAPPAAVESVAASVPPASVPPASVPPDGVPPASVPADGPPMICVPLAPGSPCAPRLWGSAEYLLWWTSAAPIATPMVTASTNPADLTPGVLGSPNTVILLGGQAYNMAARAGARFTLGTWLDPDATLGLEGTYLFLTPATSFHAAASNGSVPLSLPFFNVLAGAEDFAPLALPGLADGGAFLAVTNRLQSGEVNAAARLLANDRLRLSGLAGFRYVDFGEDLNFGFVSQNPAGALAGYDRFNANNNFFGGQLGLRGEYRVGNWFVAATGKCAFGDVAQAAAVSGGFAFVSPVGLNFATPAGFYALPTNIGHHAHSAFGVVPEATVNLGYAIGPRVRVFAGYNFLYISNVERPGTAVQHAINFSDSPGFVGPGAPLIGPALPNYVFTRSGFLAQGLNFGVQLRY